MAGLDAETLELILSTLRKYADKKLTLNYLLALDHNDEFSHEVLKELYDPNTLGLHLLFSPEEYGGLGGGAYDIYRVAELMDSIDLGVATGVLATFLGSDPIASIMALRLIEACFQTADVWKIAKQQQMALPLSIGSVTTYRQMEEAQRRLYAIVMTRDGETFCRAALLRRVCCIRWNRTVWRS